MASSWTGSLAERNEYAAAHLHLKPVQAMKLQTDVASRTWCWLSCFMENQLFEVRCGWIHFCVQMQNPCMIAWFQKIQHLQTVGQWSRSDPFSRTFHLNAYGGFQRDSSSQMVWPKRTRNCERPCEIGVNIPGPRSKTIHPKLRPVLILWACGPWMNATISFAVPLFLSRRPIEPYMHLCENRGSLCTLHSWRFDLRNDLE